MVALVATVQRHPDAISGSRRHQLHRHDRLTRLQRQPPAPRDGCEDQPRLHHGEAVADTHARAAAKWQVRVSWYAIFPLCREPLRIESLGLLEESLVAMEGVGV